MYSDLEKSCKFLFLFVSVFVFFCGVENIAAKGTVVDIDGQFSSTFATSDVERSIKLAY